MLSLNTREKRKKKDNFLLTFLATSAFSLLFPNNVGGFLSGVCEDEDAEAAE